MDESVFSEPDDTIFSVQRMTEKHFRRTKPTEKQTELLRTYVWTMADILQTGHGITKTVPRKLEDMSDDFTIVESDLTPLGKTFELCYLLQWLYHRKISKEQGTPEDFARARNQSVLKKQLELLKIRLDSSGQNNDDAPSKINSVRTYAFSGDKFPSNPDWPAQYYVTLFQSAISFMQDKGLTTRILAAGPEEIVLDFDVWTSDLTELGDVFYTILRTYWFTYDYPEEESEAAYVQARDFGKLEKLYTRAVKKFEKDVKKQTEPLGEPFIIPKRAPSSVMTKEEWVKYDDATWHMDGDFPADDAFPEDMEGNPASTHIGMFLAFMLLSGFAEEEFWEEWEDEFEQLRTKEITPGTLLTYIDFSFESEQLTDEGNAFVQSYYKQHYLNDYDKCLCEGLPTQYHVYDSWENYMKLKLVLEKRLSEWLSP